MQNSFEHKTHGRIFVLRSEDIPRVKEIIEAVDEYEFSYMPDNLVTVWAGRPNDIIYTHKFEADIDALTTECWNRGIPILCVTGKRDPLSCF